MTETQFEASIRFDVDEMANFMRTPEIYWPASDALAPQPIDVDFPAHMLSPHVWTMACKYGRHIIGYVQLIQKTAIGGEIHAGFHPSFRGKIAKSFIQHALGIAFREKGFLKIWTMIASDNRAAIYMVRNIGFQHEGRLTNAIVRRTNTDDGLPRDHGPPLRDLVVLAISKPTGN